MTEMEAPKVLSDVIKTAQSENMNIELVTSRHEDGFHISCYKIDKVILKILDLSNDKEPYN